MDSIPHIRTISQDLEKSERMVHFQKELAKKIEKNAVWNFRGNIRAIINLGRYRKLCHSSEAYPRVRADAGTGLAGMTIGAIARKTAVFLYFLISNSR